jgi:hypothetical protein
MKKILILCFVCLYSLVAFADANENDIAANEALGFEIYKNDWLAWNATDFLLEKQILQNDKHVQGWIVDTSTNPAAVHFMGIIDNQPKVLHSVYFDEHKKMSYQKNSATKGYHQQMFRARQLAAQNIVLKCSERYNTVIIPAQDGWLVYVLAATTKSNVLMIGGHSKIRINREGTTVLSAEKTYSSCMELDSKKELPKGAKSVGMFVSDSQNLLPSETTVFISLEQKIPLFVKTTTNATGWEVNKGKIRKLEK